MRTRAWQVTDPNAPVQLGEIERRDLRSDDVAIEVMFCGVCGTDVHAVEQGSPHPLVPGHEFTGRVVGVGRDVTSTAVGRLVAVGNIVDSCGECPMCLAGQENFCHRFPTLTYNGVDRRTGETTQGAFSHHYVARDAFVHPLPEKLDPAAAAPLMCAGITVWEPLRAAGVGHGTRVAVVGLGGLGHLAVKLAVALGAEVTVLGRSPGKRDDALRLGATDYIRTGANDALSTVQERFHVVLDTISVAHDLRPYLSTVALDGSLYLLGYLGDISLSALDLLGGRKHLVAAGSGGRPATAELLRFAAEHGITADIEIFPFSEAPAALERVASNQARYRAVLDLTSSES